MRVITISEACARLAFQGCSTEYISTVCHGRCCRITGGVTRVFVERDERDRLRKLGGS